MKLCINEIPSHWIFFVISIANDYVVILIYNLILSILTIDKEVLYNVYILSVLYENNCEMFAILKFVLSC